VLFQPFKLAARRCCQGNVIGTVKAAAIRRIFSSTGNPADREAEISWLRFKQPQQLFRQIKAAGTAR
jgi:hypothetical protein